MKFIFVTHTPFNYRDFKRYGLSFFSKKCDKIVIFDISNYVSDTSNDFSKRYENDSYAHNVKVHQCNSYKQLKSLIEGLTSDDIALFAMGESYKEMRIRSLFFQKKIRSGIIRGGLIPKDHYFLGKKQKNNLSAILLRLQNLGFKNFCIKVFDKLYKKFFSVAYYDYFITSNYNTYTSLECEVKAHNVFEIHSMDYDNIIELNRKETKPISNKPYVVFLDQYICGHSDFALMGLQPPIDEEEYIKLILELFQKVKKELDLDVIIAIHPKAPQSYIEKLSEYKIVANQTEQLVRDSELVITHYSTAMNYAVVYEKPLYLLLFNKGLNTPFASNVYEYTELLEQPSINMNNLSSIQLSLPVVNKEMYENYEKTFIKKNGTSTQKTIWETFYDAYVSQ